MKIIVCGAGEVGLLVAKYLVSGDHDVTIIDNSKENLQQIRGDVDVKVVTGEAADPGVLESAGASRTDAIIAVTASDEVNMLICQIGKAIFNIGVKIARVRNQNYLAVKWQRFYGRDGVGIDYFISPEREVARSLFAKINLNSGEDITLLDSEFIKTKVFRMNADLSGVTRYQLINFFADHNIPINILSCTQNGQVAIPNDSDEIRHGDEVHIIIRAEDNQAVSEILSTNFSIRNQKISVVIGGGGNVGLSLAKLLEKGAEEYNNINSINIVELGEERSQYISTQLSSSRVVNGSMLTEEIMLEANIDVADYFIAASENESVNIISALLAKKLGAKSTLALVGSNGYKNIVSSLGVDRMIDPKQVTISKILQCLKEKSQIISANIIGADSDAVELIEVDVDKYSGFDESSVKKVERDNSLKISAIIRSGKVIFPIKSTIIKAEDRLVIVCYLRSVETIEDMLKTQLTYF